MAIFSHQVLRLDEAVDHCCRDLWRPPGVVIGLCTPAGLVWSRCIGERRFGSGLPVDEHTVFALASGTKTFAVASIAQLIGQGKIDWDSRVVEIDAAFDAGDPAVTQLLTLRDLACHRIGWRSSEGRHRGAALSRADLVRRLRYHGFRHPFRQNFAYCTDGFTVLGHVVDIMAGISWEQHARRHLLTPLGMNRTSFFVPEAERSGNCTQPHLQLADGTRLAVPWYYEDGIATPAGGGNSCLADLAKWLGTWLAKPGQHLPWPTAQTAIMHAPQTFERGAFADHELSCAVTEDLTDEAYALGWYTHVYRGERIFHHTGSIRGFRSMIALLPSRELGFIALVNSNEVYLPRALFQLAQDTLQDADPMRWIPNFFKLETTWQAANAGRYRRDTGAARPTTDTGLIGSYRDDGRFGTIAIIASDDGLWFRAGQLAYRINGSGDDQYFCEQSCGVLLIDQGPLQVHRDATKRVRGFEYQGAWFERSA